MCSAPWGQHFQFHYTCAIKNKDIHSTGTTVKVYDIQLLMLPSLIFLTGCCGASIRGSTTWNRKHQTCLIFTVRDRGGSDWIGGSKIILLIPHLSNIGTNSRLRPSQGLRYALPQSLPGANGPQHWPRYHLVCGLCAFFSTDGREEEHVCMWVCVSLQVYICVHKNEAIQGLKKQILRESLCPKF